ncbi:trans-2-enoyl-CoA reductase family protein [Grimontia kaedaensis]|uniref:Enoyl-[acyl-carrier-protein] reductase [NADH] n=1 Tax=Grimontia kaedaensis TaxID=2872157 RepID=A0ABY4WSN3_9GAMM|nr:enoyl-ACP reductase FabV [Grimontia kaedaensis]USH01371.1 trans-2-enoyl-CoA reductase family protein [Grimontia kaedaensis]
MIIQPKIQGVVARSCHPFGCQAAIFEQISKSLSQQSSSGTLPKRVLVLGASSGFGLASRIALAFGPAKAATIGVSFERGVSEKGIGSAGWYNNIFFHDAAEKAGLISTNIVGDAFSAETHEQVAKSIEQDLGGQVDLVVYSLATGIRPNPETGEFWRSAIRPVGETVEGYSVNFEKNSLDKVSLPPATKQEIDETVKVMGGEDWLSWMQFLSERNLLSKGCETVAYSYIGPEYTHAIYHKGTLGFAKTHLHNTRDDINTLLKNIEGTANIAVCKALVTKASVFIPGLTPYLLALYRVMKAKGLHEGCIEQMNRLFYGKWQDAADRDAEGLIRIDDWELRDDIQLQANALLAEMTPDNFTKIGDYEGVLGEFLQLNGFEFNSVDYTQEVDIEKLKALRP